MSGESKFSLEEILAEERRARETTQPTEASQPVEEPQVAEPAAEIEVAQEGSVEEIAEETAEAVEPVAVAEEVPAAQPESGKFVLNLSDEKLDGEIIVPEDDTIATKKQKKEKKGLFARLREKRYVLRHSTEADR